MHVVTCSNLYTLEGGVHNYLTEQGGALWDGSLFVFDGRMAVPPPGEPQSLSPSLVGEPLALGSCWGRSGVASR